MMQRSCAWAEVYPCLCCPAAVRLLVLSRLLTCIFFAAELLFSAVALLQVQLLPPTPPASDLNAATAHLPQHIRRSHSLDSGLNSLTGLLDQLALGQLGSEEVNSCEYDEYCESDSWTLLDQLSEEGPNNSCSSSGNSSKGGAGASGSGGGAAADASKAAAALMLLGGGAASYLHGNQQQQQHHLQPVQEGCEEQDGAEVQVFGIGVASAAIC
jgi:hypothetical protein